MSTFKQGTDKRFNFSRPKYTRSAKALVWDQIKDLEAQTLHAEGTFEQHRQQKLIDNHFWLHGNR
mgnify:FL=1